MWVVFACLSLGAASLLLPSAPTYDPYAWLIWGRQLAHLQLDTTGAGTAWKPLPAIVDAVLSPLGSATVDGWLVVSRAGALFAVFMAYRLASRIAGRIAGVAAALTLLLVHEFVRRTAVGNAEGLMTGLGLLAIERHLDRRPLQAFALATAASLIRPEAWLFTLGYGVWLCTRREHPNRIAVAAMAALSPLLWLGGDWIGSGHPFGASAHALGSVPTAPALGPQPGVGVLREAWAMLPLPAQMSSVVALGWALIAWRRARTGDARASGAGLTLALALGAVAWVGVVAAMAQRGYPGLPRFLFMGMGLAAVVAGVGVARVATRPAASLAVLACFAVLAVPDARLLPADAAAAELVADRDNSLAAAVARAGGARWVLGCGRPYTSWFATTALAWDLGVDADAVHDRPRGRNPVVFVLDGRRPGLKAPVPRRHVHELDVAGPWDVVARCAKQA